MEFEGSTQAKSWMFSEESIADCRQRAAVINNSSRQRSHPVLPAQRVRKFASGFHQLHGASNDEQQSSRNNDKKHSTPLPPQRPTASGLSTADQETLVRFHAHQIQTLIGPSALLTDLRTSQTVLSTAIMFFRRFYLSNSVVDMNPRKIATACAFFASKCEDEKVEISLLSHATAVVELRVKNSPLCRKELHSVSITDIETAERDLMEGLNYEFRCHHPDPSIRFLTMDIAHFLSEKKHPALQVDLRDPRSHDSYHGGGSGGDRFGGMSSRSNGGGYVDYAVELAETAAEVAQRALIFSDIPFLYAPGHIAFAIVSIAMESVEMSGYMGDEMQDYLVSRHGIMNSEEEILAFSREVSKIIAALIKCPHMDLLPTAGQGPRIMEQRAEELRRVLFAVSDLRMLRQMQATAAAAAARQTKWPPQPRMLSPEPQHHPHPQAIHRPHPHYHHHYHPHPAHHHHHHYAHPQPIRRHYCGPPMAISSSTSSTSFSTLGKRRSSCFDADFTPPRKLPSHRRMARVTPTIGYMHE